MGLDGAVPTVSKVLAYELQTAKVEQVEFKGERSVGGRKIETLNKMQANFTELMIFSRK